METLRLRERTSSRLHSLRCLRRRSCVLVFCGICLFLGSGLPSRCCASDSVAQYDPYFRDSCGPVNLYVALRILGKSPTLRDVYGVCCKNNFTGASFASMKEAAERFGLSPLCVHLDAESLKTVSAVAILHLTDRPGGHFVISRGWNGNEFRVLDATRSVEDGLEYPISAARLSEIWDGATILLSQQQVESPLLRSGKGFLPLGIAVMAAIPLFWHVTGRRYRRAIVDAWRTQAQ